MITKSPAVRLLAVMAAVTLAAGACSDEDDGGAAATGGDGAAQTSDTSAAAEGPAAGPPAAGTLGLVAEGRLTACTDPSHPPFSLEADGQLDGIDVELVRGLAGRLALTADFKEVDLDGVDTVVAALEARQCDVVASSVPMTEESQGALELTDAYFTVRQSLLVRSGDAATYDGLESLSGRTVGVQAGTTGAAFVEESAPGATVREYPGTAALFAALRDRQVDAVVHDYPVTTHHARTTEGTVVSATFTEGPVQEYALALPKGQGELKAALDDAIAQVSADDTYPTVLRRFLGDTAGQIEPAGSE